MICPSCGFVETRVNESRDVESGLEIRRRRECVSCKYRFTTYERAENPSLLVVKRSGGKESYSREKLARGVSMALGKRSFTADDVDRLVSEVERKINLLGKDEVLSSVIGDMVLSELQRTDKVASLRFASVYKSFEDVETFKKELDLFASDNKTKKSK